MQLQAPANRRERRSQASSRARSAPAKRRLVLVPATPPPGAAARARPAAAPPASSSSSSATRMQHWTSLPTHLVEMRARTRTHHPAGACPGPRQHRQTLAGDVDDAHERLHRLSLQPRLSGLAAKLNKLAMRAARHSAEADGASKLLRSSATAVVALPKSAARRTRAHAKQKAEEPIAINVANARFPVVAEVARELGYRIVDADTPQVDTQGDIFWYDGPPPQQVFKTLQPHQRINNFPCAHEISRKDCLARNLGQMRRAHPKEYDFVPRSWIIPAEHAAFQSHHKSAPASPDEGGAGGNAGGNAGNAGARARAKRCYIVKPVNSAMGKGIFLIMSPSELYASGALLPGDSAIVQEYLADPLLIEGFKFDLRIYVLITCCDPLRVRAVSRSISLPWGSIRFRLALRTYDAPPGGPSVRVVSQTKYNQEKYPPEKYYRSFW